MPKRDVTKRRNAIPSKDAQQRMRELLDALPPPRSDYDDQPLENTSQRIIAHKREACEQDRHRKNTRPCPIHNRTAHHMRAWPQNWRDDTGIMERICPHGVGHPDPDDQTKYRVHGCDGCCRPPA